MNPLKNQFSENGIAQKFSESWIIIKSTAQYLWTWCQGIGVPRYFSPGVAFGVKFRYLLSGSEREKCWSPDHMLQIPFVHDIKQFKKSNSTTYIFATLRLDGKPSKFAILSIFLKLI